MNLRSTKRCILCKHFYNPTGKGIKMKPGPFAEVDQTLRSHCTVRGNVMVPATHICAKFDPKF